MGMRKCPQMSLLGKGRWVNQAIRKFPHVSNVLSTVCAHRYYEVELALPSLGEVYLTLPYLLRQRHAPISHAPISHAPIMGDHDLPSHAPTRRPLSQASRPSLATAAPSQTSSSLKSTRSAPALPVRLAGSTRAARTAGGLACGETAACKGSSGRCSRGCREGGSGGRRRGGLGRCGWRGRG